MLRFTGEDNAMNKYIDYFKFGTGGIVLECLFQSVWSVCVCVFVCVCVCQYLSDFVETSGPVPGGVMETLESLRMIHVCTVQPSPPSHTHTHTRTACAHTHAHTQHAGRGSLTLLLSIFLPPLPSSLSPPSPPFLPPRHLAILVKSHY